MSIEILYAPGCPNFQPAVEQVERILSSESLQAEIRSIAVRTYAEARELMFPGSPTGDPCEWRGCRTTSDERTQLTLSPV
jgi:hypothetical protein